MAGHSHWKQIKAKKESLDLKKGQLFSKLLNAITVAARQDPDPQFNSRLKAAIEKAKAQGVPSENIERAIERAHSLSKDQLEEVILEAYGPGGSALLIEIITDNKNRSVAEIKNILKNYQGKLGEPGSVRWIFEYKENEWQPKFKQELMEEERSKLNSLIKELEEHNDVQKIYVNV